MTERLVIHNFGPIQKAEMDVRDLTVFVGPQATGKSIASQALYFLRGVEDLLSSESGMSRGALEATLSALEWWFGNPPSIYAGLDARLRWDSAESAGNTAHEIWWDQDGAHLSERLKSRVWRWLEAFDYSRLGHRSEYRTPEDAPKQVYIPAGRVLYSFIPPYSRIAQRSSQQWPGYVLTFYGTLGMSIAELWQLERQEQFTQIDAVFSAKFTGASFVQQRIDAIINGQIQYGPDTILLKIGQKQLRSATIAAGQMETWPFWTIMGAGFTFNTQVYFEELEAHLHPGAQRSVMEIIAYLVGRKTKFVLTTHSPYILYAINNFLMVHKVLAAGKDLPPDVSPETALRPEQVAAYRFASDGTVHDIMDTEVGLIDEDELDRVADEMGETFSRLQERLEDVE